ncbi:MAG: hypothetical protein ACKPKO_40055, partial [Candidatus Fonsibacter sp.]
MVYLNEKAPKNNPTFTGTVAGITKAMVGLGNVDNTTDANKPISTLTQTALNGKQDTLSALTNVSVGNVSGSNITGAIGTFNWIRCTASSGRPTVPTTYGAYLGNVGTQYSALELVCDLHAYIDFTRPNVDAKGRFLYNVQTPVFSW